MRERPILFSAEMVRAILAGTKTQTRRIVTPRTEHDRELLAVADARDAHHRAGGAGDGSVLRGTLDALAHRSPCGVPGDRLWVREAWRTSIFVDDKPGSVLETPGNGYGWPVWYAADNGAVTWRGARDGGPGFINPGRYRHARFMPRWASRITLSVESVRVERLQEISEEDACAEGMRWRDTGLTRYGQPRPGWSWRDPHPADVSLIDSGDHCLATAALAFGNLWNEINAKRAPWSSNPWVWVVSFKRVEDGARRC